MKDFIKILLAVLLIAVVRNLCGLYNYEIGIDDSNIYFVYVKNLSEGHGFVYNIGGPKVEGFTSFLWAILLTIIYNLKFLPFETTLLVVCFLLTTGIVFVFFRYCKSLFNEGLAWLLAAYILLTPGFIDWNVFTLLDICLWIFAGSWAILLLLSGGNKRTLFYITILLPLIRPEGLALAPLIGVLKIIKDYSIHSSLKKAWKENGLFLVAIFASIIALTTFRYLYFGYPVPNTFYAKVSYSIGTNIKQAFFYFYDALRHTTLFPFILLAISLLTILLRKYIVRWRANINVIILTIIILFFVSYPFLTGGDHFKYSRFFQPVFPLIGLLFILLFHDRINWKRSISVAVVILSFLVLNFNSTDTTSVRDSGLKALGSYVKGLRPDLVSPSQLQTEFNIAVYGKRLAVHMKEVMADCDSIPSYAVVAAGGIGYAYPGKVIDLMGLNNPEMAHAHKVKSQGIKNHGSFDKKVFYRQDADIMLSWPDPLTGVMQQTDSAALGFLKQLEDPQYFINRVCDHIFNDEAFKQQYSYCKISNGQKHFYGFIKYSRFIQQHPELQVSKLN
jgi:hypothetical protein